MSRTLSPINFWVDDIPVKEVISASCAADFGLNNVNDLGERLNYSSLYKVEGEEKGLMVLEMRGGGFVEFIAK